MQDDIALHLLYKHISQYTLYYPDRVYYRLLPYSSEMVVLIITP